MPPKKKKITTNDNTEKRDKLLRQLYYDTETPSSAVYAGENALRRVAAGKSAADIHAFLSAQDTHTLQRQARRRFPRNPIICDGPNREFAADIVDMSSIAAANDGINFLLTVIDCFSNKAYVRLLPRKSGPVTAQALQEIFDKLPLATTLNTDMGREFYNKDVLRYLTTRKIRLYTTGTMKAWKAERFNRTLRELIAHHLTEHETERYVDVLQNLVRAYNSRPSRSLGDLSPNAASLEKNHFHVRTSRDLAADRRIPDKPNARYKVGDKVRVSVSRLEARKLSTFRKRSWQPNFSEAIYIIREVYAGRAPRPMYRLMDFRQRPVSGRFYEEELVRYTGGDVYKISQVLRERTIRGRRQVQVRWLGYDEPEWIDASTIVRSYGENEKRKKK